MINIKLNRFTFTLFFLRSQYPTPCSLTFIIPLQKKQTEASQTRNFGPITTAAKSVSVISALGVLSLVKPHNLVIFLYSQTDSLIENENYDNGNNECI